MYVLQMHLVVSDSALIISLGVQNVCVPMHEAETMYVT